MSSRPGPSSQPPPLSHSLLSQLELGENDPNTFREIIDDLTVQNKKLKRELRKHERVRNSPTKHDGLFEVRVRNLSDKKKHELENILQQFASTVQLSTHGVVQEPSVLGSRQPTDAPVIANSRSSSQSSYVQTLDSAYASVSTTGGTFKRPPGSSGHFKNPSRLQADHSTHHAPQTIAHRSVQETRSPSLTGTSERSRQELVVKRLEEVFPKPDVDRTAADHAQTYSAAPRQTHTSPADPDLPQGKSLMDGMPGLQRYGATSALASTSSQLHHDWIYLNLLINMAQLHILNVTPEFVRQAIRDVSTRLRLSDDGGKVRWQGSLFRTVDPDHPIGGLAPSDSIHLANYQSNPNDQLQQKCEIALSAPRQNQNRSQATEGFEPRERAEAFSALAPRKAPVTKLHYKPLFAHAQGRRMSSDRSSQDTSCDSSSPSSENEEDHTGFDDSVDPSDPSNGPLVFFDKDSFFIDMSADRAQPHHITRSSYSSLIKEPLGGRRVTRRTSGVCEKKQEASFAVQPGDEDRWRSTSPGLHIYRYNQPSAHKTDNEEEPIHLEASGIGGIQLDDNFAVNVRGLHAPITDGAHPRPPMRHRLHNTIPAGRNQTRTQSQSQHILSTTTTHLPPSPLPPPSYVYPTLSSSSSESDDGDSMLDDIDSDSELEFRRVSLSPQMRMFLEQQEPVSPQRQLVDSDWTPPEEQNLWKGDKSEDERDDGSDCSEMAG
ncbi:MAG: hypothetical protein Q9208_004699 [Pyrenodesmia sp. 3 TL-2023]